MIGAAFVYLFIFLVFFGFAIAILDDVVGCLLVALLWPIILLIAIGIKIGKGWK